MTAASSGFMMGPQARWRRVLLLALLPMLAAFFYYAAFSNRRFLYSSRFRPSPSTPHHEPHNTLPFTDHPHHSRNLSIPGLSSVSGDVDATMATVIKALYGPILHPIAAVNFTDEDGETYYLPKADDGTYRPRFTRGLGKRVLILDVDSRPLKGEGQILGDDVLKWKGVRPLAAGMLSHYLFALIHGYTYKFINAPSYSDRWGTWTKVPMMLSALRTREFDYIVFMDSDVVMHYPHLPLEWLLNYWDVKQGMLSAMAIDPDESQNYDDKGNRYLNTGFVVLQSDYEDSFSETEGSISAPTRQQSAEEQMKRQVVPKRSISLLEEMLIRWAECPEESASEKDDEDGIVIEPIDVSLAKGDTPTTKAGEAVATAGAEQKKKKKIRGYKGCAHWRTDWPHEQAAFGTYIRYDPLFSTPISPDHPRESSYLDASSAALSRNSMDSAHLTNPEADISEAIKVLPCVEANGAPEAENRGGCKGIFVRHYWVDKGRVAASVSDGIMQYVLPRLHKMWRGEDDVADEEAEEDAVDDLLKENGAMDDDTPEGEWAEEMKKAYDDATGEEPDDEDEGTKEEVRPKKGVKKGGWNDDSNVVDAKGFKLDGADVVQLDGEEWTTFKKGSGTGGANLKEEGW